jgi:hypothetical protein
MSETESVIRVGEHMPRVDTVSHHGAYEIVVSWTSGPRERQADIVDLAPVILTHKFYRPLRDNPEMLKTVHATAEGTAIAWGEDDAIDMSATTIERLAEEAMSSEDFRAWLERHKFTYETASAQLGISRRLVAYYADKRRIPRYIALACRYLDTQLVPPGFVQISGEERTGLIEAIRRNIEERSALATAMAAISPGALGNEKEIPAILKVLKDADAILQRSVVREQTQFKPVSELVTRGSREDPRRF